ncbi:phosphotransferase family protein [Amycolatopsis alkalitolerans]|uniref:Aminoglycoside phosphotransferase family protein n=1 Tax=Amycolatopsis alkalitolerans TaxID=2547244 RepID=A0A5C4LQD9_9PSEU|nr:phosphotransferase [Amycolatopsis alkalitolerans]TNC19223.1 aminoglycoside phosphotransferase family protein [Amycolatopsis alkalitolerans]
MEDAFVASALDAALDVGRRLGLPTDAPEVLSRRSNVLVRLGPVVARVPATTRLLRPAVADWMAHDVALSAFLAERGAPVIPPFEEPGPHLSHGLAVTMWPFTRLEPGHPFAPAEVAALLHDLHAALREYPGDLGAAGPAGDLRRALDHVEDERVHEAVEHAIAGLPELPSQPLHGDAHAGNLALTEHGPRWLDFEDSWRGPIAWDLACLDPAARAAYPGNADGVEEYVRLRKLLGVCWRFVVARRFPDRFAEAKAAAEAYFSATS